jgi:hypothetical protein
VLASRRTVRCWNRRQRGKFGPRCLFERLAAAAIGWQPHRKRLDGTPEKDPGRFNAHSPDGGGSGLVQHVLRSPARIPAVESPRRGLCAAPASVKRCTLSCVIWAVTQPAQPVILKIIWRRILRINWRDRGPGQGGVEDGQLATIARVRKGVAVRLLVRQSCCPPRHWNPAVPGHPRA